MTMSLQIKLENIFKNLVETEQKFGVTNKFISLVVKKLDGTESIVEDAGKIYLGILKFYNVVENTFKTVDLFIKIEQKVLKQSKRGSDQDSQEQQINYDFKFHNEYVAYKYILPVLNKYFKDQSEESMKDKHGSVSFNEEIDSAYTIEEFKNDVRYREIGKSRGIHYRHSWNPSTHEQQKPMDEEKFFTIKPNSTIAFDKCEKYHRQTSKNTNDEILRLFPKFYYGDVGDNELEDNIVVIENMLPAGFHTSNEEIYLDKDRVLLTLQALGKFHASSYIAKHKIPDEFKKTVNKLKATGWTLPQYWDIYPNFLNEHLLRGINFLKTDPHYKKHLHKFDPILENPKDYFFNILETDENMAVICHGDFCKNNILYRYKSMFEELNTTDIKTSEQERNTLVMDQGNLGKEQKFNINEFQNEGKREANNDTVRSISNSLDFPGPHDKAMYRDKMDQFNDENYCEDKKSFTPVQAQLIKTENVAIMNTSRAISDKRKSFLKQILEINSQDQIHPIKHETKENKDGYDHGEKFINKESSINKSIDIRYLGYSDCNEIQTTTQNRNSLNELNKANVFKDKDFKKSITTVSLTDQIKTESSLENYNGNSYTRNDKAIEVMNDQKNHAITDRLNYLEEKFKELERIYKVNQCVLEKKRVNMQIIEKLNEKKQILEEICKKIENINAKQEIESKLQSSITRLYQNVDDLDLKKRKKSLVSEMKIDISNKNRLKLNEKATNPQETVTIQNIKRESFLYGKEAKCTNTNATMNNENKRKNDSMTRMIDKKISHKKQSESQHYSKRNNIEEEFNSLYQESFAEDNLTDYEMVFGELIKKVDSIGIERNSDSVLPDDVVFEHGVNEHLINSSARNRNEVNNNINKNHKLEKELFQNKTLQTINTKIGNGSTTEIIRDETQADYLTLSVKQRRDNLERSISLANELKSFEKNRKGMKRSSSDIKLVNLSKPLISERNISLNAQNVDIEFERETLKRELLKSALNKSRARFFTSSSMSINVDEETESDEVFENSTISTRESYKTRADTTNEVQNTNNEELKRSMSFVDIRKSNPRPVPMKRTISLIQEPSIDSKSNNNIDLIEVTNKNYGFISEKRYTEIAIGKKQSTISGVNDADDKDVKTNQKSAITTATETKTQNQTKKSETLDQRARSIQSEKSKLLEILTKPRKTTPVMKNNIDDIVFFDLARMIYSSPVIDLSFFLFLNVSHELRTKYWDEFISSYYFSLSRSVPADIQIPSQTDFCQELKKKALYGYFLCSFFLPWMMEEHPHQEVNEWIHHGGQAGTEAVANILKFIIDRDLV